MSSPIHSPNGLLTPEEFEWLLQNPEQARDILAIQRAEDHLLDFMRYCWAELEPAGPMITGWAFEAIAEHLEAVHHGKIRKLLMNVPPGFSKSLSTSVFFPAWEWGPRNCGWMKYLCASYGQHLTERDNDKFRRLIKSPTFTKAWGQNVQIVKDSVIKIESKQTGFKFATSSTGVGTGERAHRRITDDPHNVSEAESDQVRGRTIRWYTETMSTRYIPIPPGFEGTIPDADIVIMQRVHEQDVAGAILSAANALGYEHLCIEMEFDPEHPVARKRRSMIGWRDPRAVRFDLGDSTAIGELAWPELHSSEKVDEMKERMRLEGGEYAEAGQLQQWPVSRQGGMCKADQIIIVEPHQVPRWTTQARGWDFAGTEGDDRSPYTVGAKGMIVDGILYITDIYRERIDAGDLENVVVEVIKKDGYGVEQDIPQDPGQAGKAQKKSFMKRLHGYLVWSSTEIKNKVERAKPFASQVNGGNVRMVKGPWNAACLAEIKTFPASRFKDQVDALSRMYARLLSGEPEDECAGGFTSRLGAGS